MKNTLGRQKQPPYTSTRQKQCLINSDRGGVPSLGLISGYLGRLQRFADRLARDVQLPGNAANIPALHQMLLTDTHNLDHLAKSLRYVQGRHFPPGVVFLDNTNIQEKALRVVNFPVSTYTVKKIVYISCMNR